MNLSKRLQAIVSLVPKDIPSADIGADHGLLITYLVKNNIIPYGYASDNKKGPYDNLTKRIQEENLFSKIETSLCDGLSSYSPKKYPTIIICGMGGDLIKNILKKDENKVKQASYLLLGPQGLEYELRSYLSTIGFYPEEEVIVFEDHFYEILLYSKNEKEVNEEDKKYGYFLRRRKDEIFIKKYESLIKINENILSCPSLNEEKRNKLVQENKIYNNLIKSK